MRVSMDNTLFKKDMKNIIDYSLGYLDGINAGKTIFFKNLGEHTANILGEYIDANSRVNPQALQHVYEWYQTGSPEGRLFDIQYTVSNLGLSINSNFRQSNTIKDGSTVPFYDKAKIIENGVPVKIKPKYSDVLVFEEGGETVFTKKEILVLDPGGTQAQGQYEKTFDSFFTKYFTQAFLRSSGVDVYLNNPILYKKNLQQGKRAGRSAGYSTGFKWIANAGVIK